MKVLMTADPIGGVWTYALELARGLTSEGVEVSVAVEGGEPSEPQRAELDNLPLAGWWSTNRKLEWMPEPWRDVDATGAWLQELAGIVRPDLVHLNSFSHGALGWDVPVVLTAHSCVPSWWRSVHGVDAPAEWDEYRTRVEAGLRGADVVTAPTAAFFDRFRALYDVQNPAAIIPNGIASLNPNPVKEPVVLAAGRVWDEAKNVAALASIAPRLPWPVVVVGDAPKVATRSVTYTGKLARHDLHRRMEASTIFCAPARYEPFGLAALEAASAGCALVLGAIPTLREVWEDAARFVEPNDPEDLRRACVELIEDPELRLRMAARATQRAAAFTRERMVAGYLDVYRSLTASRSQGTRAAAR